MAKADVKVKPQTARGMRDFLPADEIPRAALIQRIKTIFELYGYEPLTSPAVERLDVLQGKTGEEGDQLMFKILKREFDPAALVARSDLDFREIADLGLRYDLTVPLSRIVAMYANELPLPFKRYQIQPVWRAERPQKGRYREFYQCDVDAVGSDSMMADAEIIAIIHDVLRDLAFGRFTILLNNRKILRAMYLYSGMEAGKEETLTIAIDKLDKIGVDGVLAELRKRGITENAISRLLPLLQMTGSNRELLGRLRQLFSATPIGIEGILELEQILEYTESLGVPSEAIRVELFLARGLSYYTGPIFESKMADPGIPSLSGGGRYDKLVGVFLGREIPATGSSVGIERIYDILKQRGLLPNIRSVTQVLVTIYDEQTRAESLVIARELRQVGIKSEVYLSPLKGYKKQLSYADSKTIPVVVLAGPDELAAAKVTIKLMTADPEKPHQVTVARGEMIDAIQSFLG